MSAAPLQLDFGRAERSAWRWLGWVALLMAVLAAGTLADAYTLAAARRAEAQSRYDMLDARARAGLPRHAVTPTDPQTAARIRRANGVIDQLAVPWDELFDAVEAANARGLGLLSLTPSARDRTLRLGGEARSVAEVLAYVNRLAKQPALGQVHLLGYNTVTRDGIAIVTFALAATWRRTQP